LKLIEVNKKTMQDKGTVVRVNERGFGFIKREGADKDLFFHANELVGVAFNDLREGDEVTFEVTDGPKGPQASKVSRA
jgi:CspA family cold shock protein